MVGGKVQRPRDGRSWKNRHVTDLGIKYPAEDTRAVAGL